MEKNMSRVKNIRIQIKKTMMEKMMMKILINLMGNEKWECLRFIRDN